jgi:hypothetical protein
MNKANIHTRLLEIGKASMDAIAAMNAANDRQLQISIIAIEVHIEAIRHEIGEPEGMRPEDLRR